jgi:hypothetical protein
MKGRYNRRFRVLPKQQQTKLYRLYGDLSGFAYGQLNERITKDVTISYFDHWLDKDEFHLLDSVEIKDHLQRREIFESFYKDLAESYELYSYRVFGKRKNNMKFRSFSNSKAMHDYFTSTDYKKGKDTYPKITIPEFNAVLHEGYDYCIHLGFNETSDVSSIVDLAYKNGLHVLKPRYKQGCTT